MTIYMMTMPRTPTNKKILKIFIEQNDIHKWVIGYETGRSGYEHFQIRLQFGGDFERLKDWFVDAHIEEASNDWRYERKSGHFVSSDDTVEIRKCRFGRLRNNQRHVLQLLDKQGDRGVLVWFDRMGGIGKSWFCRYLYEKGLAYYVPPTIKDPKSIIQYVCAGYQGEKYIVIDIPRSAKWSESLYTAIEAIKDGLIYDTRYTARIRDIWGVKILALTNTMPEVGALSKDRWKICNRDGLYASSKMLSIVSEKMNHVSTVTSGKKNTEINTKSTKKRGTKKLEVDS